MWFHLMEGRKRHQEARTVHQEHCLFSSILNASLVPNRNIFQLILTEHQPKLSNNLRLKDSFQANRTKLPNELRQLKQQEVINTTWITVPRSFRFYWLYRAWLRCPFELSLHLH